MCEAAQEIQCLKNTGFDFGDFASIEGNSFIVPNIPVTCTQMRDKFFITIKKTSWLPRQDQLQEIIGFENFYEIISNFNNFIYKPILSLKTNFDEEK